MEPAAPEIIHPALVKLAQGQDLLRQIVADRPALMTVALLNGATPQRVVEAAGGLELIEMRGAVGRWAAWLRHAGQLAEGHALP